MTETTALNEREQKQELVNKGNKYLQAAQSVQIASDEDYVAASELKDVGKKEIKAIKEFMDPHIKRAHEAHRALTQDRAKMERPINEGVRLLKSKIGGYNETRRIEEQKERARRAEEERQREEASRKAEEDRRLTEAQKLEDAGLKEEAEAVLDAPQPSAKRMVSPVKNTPAPKTSNQFRERWLAEVLDKEKVPEMYKIVDVSALNKIAQALKSQAQVPGVRFYRDDIIV